MTLRSSKKFYPPGTIVVTGHRGDMVNYPENTLLSFRQAVLAGANAIEVDTRLTQDGVIVVLHDDSLGRTTNGTGSIRAVTWDYVSTLDAGSWKGAEFADRDDCRVPRVVDLLDEFRDAGVAFEFDVKVFESVAPTVVAVRERRMQRQCMFVVNAAVAETLRASYPDIIVSAAAVLEPGREWVAYARAGGFPVVQYPASRGFTRADATIATNAARPIQTGVLGTGDLTATFQNLVTLGGTWFGADLTALMVSVLATNGLTPSATPYATTHAPARTLAPSGSLAPSRVLAPIAGLPPLTEAPEADMVFWDEFEDYAETLLTDHPPAPWNPLASEWLKKSTSTISIRSNGAEGNSSSRNYIINAGASDLELETVVTMPAAARTAYVVVRSDEAFANAVELRLNSSDGTAKLIAFTPSLSTLGSVDAGIAVGTAYKVNILAVGTSLRVFLNGTEVEGLAATLSANQANTFVGIGGSNGGTRHEYVKVYDRTPA
jgi:hypothetical protein